MKYGRILSATQRDGVIFPHFFVTRRAQTPVCFSPYSLNCEKWLPSLTTCICRYTLFMRRQLFRPLHHRKSPVRGSRNHRRVKSQ
jgi:hypothetical protein